MKPEFLVLKFCSQIMNCQLKLWRWISTMWCWNLGSMAIFGNFGPITWRSFEPCLKLTFGNMLTGWRLSFMGLIDPVFQEKIEFQYRRNCWIFCFIANQDCQADKKIWSSTFEFFLAKRLLKKKLTWRTRRFYIKKVHDKFGRPIKINMPRKKPEVPFWKRFNW